MPISGEVLVIFFLGAIYSASKPHIAAISDRFHSPIVRP